MSIRQAALRNNISYPTAKAINRIYLIESRIDKKKNRVKRSKASKLACGSAGQKYDQASTSKNGKNEQIEDIGDQLSQGKIKMVKNLSHDQDVSQTEISNLKDSVSRR